MKLVKDYYSDGKLKAIGNADTLNKKQGKWTYFYESGKKSKEIEYIDDIENGVWKMWHASGALFIEQYKSRGKSQGLWKEYYEDGKIKEEGVYKDNNYSPINFWDENGNQLLKNGTGKKIERFGAYNLDVYEHYFENGNLVKEVKLSSFRFEGFIERKGSDTD